MRSEEVFFREWSAGRGTGARRSLPRARALLRQLGLTGDVAIPTLAIVGSKGKGTTATYASAYLAAAGRRVVTITGPSYRSHRERIRVDGRAISQAELAYLSEQVAKGVQRLPGRTPGDGYLAPSGLFAIAGMLHARSQDADVVVLEAGQGGRSDEASLFPATVVAITPIFAEHLGKLGGSVPDIARDKAGIIGRATRSVVSAPQREDVQPIIAAAVAELPGQHTEPEVATPSACTAPTDLLARGLNTANAALGCVAAQRLLDATCQTRPGPGRLRAVLSSVRLPGRLSWHRLPGTAAEILADSAINRAGVAAAVAAARERWNGIDHVVACFPDHKDLPGAVAELAGLSVTFVRLPDRHLRFERELPSHWRVMDAADLTRGVLADLGDRILALGIVYFVGRILDLADADTERLFTV